MSPLVLVRPPPFAAARRRAGLALLPFLLALAACGGGTGNADAAAHDGAAGDAAAGDAAAPDGAPGDAAPGDGARDTAAPDTATGDTATGDTAVGDAGAGDTGAGGSDASRPAGQCVMDLDCGGGLTCTVSAPGGICAGCGGSCPLGLAYECLMGSCVRTCYTDDDCPWGLRCSGGALCALISCSGPTCPAPFTCQGGFCRRPPCSGGCPVGWTCRDTTCTER
jgi:hypothetical protein